MFDGGVNTFNGYVSYTTKSIQLIRDIIKIMDELNLRYDYISKQKDKYGRYRIEIRKKLNLKKALKLFEKKTDKWYILKEHLYGIQKSRTLILSEANKVKIIIHLNLFYPKKRISALSLADIVNIFDLHQELKVEEVQKLMFRKKTCIYEALKKLEKIQILSSKRKGLNKVWYLKNLLPIIRRN